MRTTLKRAWPITVVLLLLILDILAGCSSRFLDPSQIGRFRPTPAVNVILDSLGVAEETPVPWQKAEDPRPNDIIAVKSDYMFGSGDVVRISVFELYQEGVTFVQDYVVTETGKISMPDVGVVQAAGLTERQLEEEIVQIISPGLLKEPSVSVTLLSSQQNTFSILGAGVPRPNRYLIPRYDFRLTDALSTAGGPAQFNVSYIYVSRREEETEQQPSPAESQTGNSESGQLDTYPMPQSRANVFESQRPGFGRSELTTVGSPLTTVAAGGILQNQQQKLQQERGMSQTPRQGQSRWPQSEKVMVTPTEMARPGELYRQTTPGRYGFSGDNVRTAISPGNLSSTAYSAQSNNATGSSSSPGQVKWIFQDGKWIPVPVGPAKPPEPEIKREEKPEARIEWIFRDGKWVPVPIGPAGPVEPGIRAAPGKEVIPLEGKLAEQLQWEGAIQGRVIKIPVSKLLAGDPRYNIVIKPGDTIHVPVDIVGECWITGNVNYRGPINLIGRPMTLKMAIAAAGGPGPLAWPKNCEVIRRIGQDREEIVMVDLDKIARGEQPDFFIKPNDLINVGTDATSRWRAVLRNALRATYGFGFVYDRNFADADYGKGFRLPNWF